MPAARIIGGRLMAVCGNCGKIIRVDKPLLGSINACATKEERAKFSDLIAERARMSEQLLHCQET